MLPGQYAMHGECLLFLTIPELRTDRRIQWVRMPVNTPLDDLVTSTAFWHLREHSGGRGA